MKWLIVVAVTVAVPCLAATDQECDAFVAAFGKAGKIVTGKALKSDDAAFFKKSCLKKASAEVKKDTSCFSAAKDEASVKTCMK